MQQLQLASVIMDIISPPTNSETEICSTKYRFVLLCTKFSVDNFQQLFVYITTPKLSSSVLSPWHQSLEPKKRKIKRRRRLVWSKKKWYIQTYFSNYTEVLSLVVLSPILWKYLVFFSVVVFFYYHIIVTCIEKYLVL